jgi:hypothetical protein
MKDSMLKDINEICPNFLHFCLIGIKLSIEYVRTLPVSSYVCHEKLEWRKAYVTYRHN